MRSERHAVPRARDDEPRVSVVRILGGIVLALGGVALLIALIGRAAGFTDLRITLTEGDWRWLAVCAAVTAQTNERSVEVPAWAGSGRCAIGSAPARDVAAGGRVALACASARLTVSCDFEATEPFDVSVETLCQAGRLPVVPGDAVPIGSTTAARYRATIQWLDIDSDGRPTTVATRVQDVDAAATV